MLFRSRWGCRRGSAPAPEPPARAAPCRDLERGHSAEPHQTGTNAATSAQLGLAGVVPSASSSPRRILFAFPEMEGALLHSLLLKINLEKEKQKRRNKNQMLSDNTEQIPIWSSRQLEPEVCLSVTQMVPFLGTVELSSSPSRTSKKTIKKRTAVKFQK